MLPLDRAWVINAECWIMPPLLLEDSNASFFRKLCHHGLKQSLFWTMTEPIRFWKECEMWREKNSMCELENARDRNHYDFCIWWTLIVKEMKTEKETGQAMYPRFKVRLMVWWMMSLVYIKHTPPNKNVNETMHNLFKRF